MEERVLIKSERYNISKALIIIVIIGSVISALMFWGSFISSMNHYDSAYENYLEHKAQGHCYWNSSQTCWACEKIKENPTKLSYIPTSFEETFSTSLIPVATIALISGLLYLWLHSYELTVTDKRIYGKIAWGKRVDLPVDSVSATATIRALKGVSVSTSSGRISFLVIKNADEIYQVMNNLLVERQQRKVDATDATPKSNEADQLKKYKDLLDSGIITQEEFDAKKKQLLGL